MYNKSTFKQVLKEFNLTLTETRGFFADIPEVQPTKYLQDVLPDYEALATAVNTEKAKSEFLIALILLDVRRQLNNRISLFSGVEFDVDKERRLNGFCDFLISQSPIQKFVSVPIVAIAEAKNDNPQNGFGQCVSAMVAAQIFNEREGAAQDVIYGVATTGIAWRFLKLEGSHLTLDQGDYYIAELEKILRDSDVYCWSRGLRKATMFLFTFTAKPKLGTRKAKSVGGAYINCWINFNSEDGAKLLAKFYLEKSGWILGRKTEQHWIEKEDYLSPDQVEYFLTAEATGSCLVAHTWPIGSKK